MKKLIAAFLSCAILWSCTIGAMAASFPDMADTAWDWARDTVDSLVEQGIIKGYSDGTYQPNNSVTNQEAFTLFARILGVNEAVNADAVQAAQDMYGDVAAQYNTYATKELCYMLYRNALTQDEIDSYLNESRKNLPMLRHEAAVLITKIMGGEDEIKNAAMYVLDYTDVDQIPATSKGYIAFVKDKGIMQGMDDGSFSPNSNVTRAQIAIMLKKTMDVMTMTHNSGTIESVDPTGNSITIDGNLYTFNDRTTCNLDGVRSSIDELSEGDSAVVTTTYSGVWAVDVKKNTDPVIPDETVSGVFGGSQTDTSGTHIKIYDLEEGISSTKEYTVNSDTVYTFNGTVCRLADFDPDAYITLELKNGRVISMSGESRITYIDSAYVAEMVLDQEPSLKITHADSDYDGKAYPLSDQVTVRRNSQGSSLREIVPGDRVDLTLEYGFITEIDATSSLSTERGTIESITISNHLSEIGLLVGGESKTYAIVRDTVIYVNDQEASLYDLRLGDSVTVNIESDTVKEIFVSSVGQVTSLTGTVQLVNTQIGFISLTVTDSSGAALQQQVFVNEATSIISSATATRKQLSDIEAGDIIMATGAMNMGAFEAATIILMDNE